MSTRGLVKWVKDIADRTSLKNSREHNTEEENRLLDEAIHRFETARAEKTDFKGENLHTKWKRFDKMFRNEQWQQPVPPDRSTPVVNFTFSLTQAVLNQMIDNRPEVILKPRRSQKDNELADMLMGILDNLWYHNRMQEEKLEEMVLPALKYGTSIAKVIWDPDMWDGLGDVRYTTVHPMNFFPDPRAYSIDTLDYCFVRMPKSLEYFYRRWPEKGQYVVPDNDWKDTEQLEGRDNPSQEDSATLTEYWFRDKNGNVCVMYYAGGTVLELMGGEYDDTNPEEPIYRHNRFPFARLLDYPAEKEFWGVGEIEMMETLQRLINSYESQIIDNTRLMANAQWLVDKTRTGLTEEHTWMLQNRPGAVTFVNDIEGIRREPGVPIPHHVTSHLQELIFWMEKITGIHEVTQGDRPSGVRAASAIIALQEAASVRIRQKTKHLEATLREITEQAMFLVLENYDEPRTVRLGGDLVPATTDVREALVDRMIDMADEAGELQGVMQEAADREAAAMPAPVEGIEEGMEGAVDTPGMDEGLEDTVPIGRDEVEPVLMEQYAFPDFDVEIHVGPSIPYSQALLYEQAKEFYQLGAIDRKALLESTSFPNKEEILARMGEGALGEEGMTEEAGASPGEQAAAGGEAVGEMF